MRFFLFFLVCVYLLTSCKNTNGEIDYSKAITLPFNAIDSSQINLSSRIKTESIIPLETTPQSLISDVDKLCTYKNYIMILDRRGAKAVMVFDKKGKFIRKIGKLGKRPGQYIMIDDFSIDKENALVYTLVNQNRINVYDLSGNFRETFKLKGFFGSRMEYLTRAKKLYFTCEDLKGDNLVITNLKGEIIKSYFPNNDRGEKGDHIRIQVHSFANSDTALLYRRYLDDNVYSTTDVDLAVKYKIDFGDKGLTTSKLNEFMKLSDDSIKRALIPYKRDVKYFTENDKFIEILFFYNKTAYIGFYDKATHTSTSIPYKKITDDILYQKGTNISEFVIDGKFASIVQPTTIPKTDSVKNELKRFSIDQQRIKIDNNPYIWIYSNK